MSLQTWKDEFAPELNMRLDDFKEFSKSLTVLQHAEWTKKKYTGLLKKNMDKHVVWWRKTRYGTITDSISELDILDETCTFCMAYRGYEQRSQNDEFTNCANCEIAKRGECCMNTVSPWKAAVQGENAYPMIELMEKIIEDLKGEQHES